MKTEQTIWSLLNCLNCAEHKFKPVVCLNYNTCRHVFLFVYCMHVRTGLGFVPWEWWCFGKVRTFSYHFPKNCCKLYCCKLKAHTASSCGGMLSRWNPGAISSRQENTTGEEHKYRKWNITRHWWRCSIWLQNSAADWHNPVTTTVRRKSG